MKFGAFIIVLMSFSVGHAAVLGSCRIRSESTGASFGPQESTLNLAEVEQSKELIEGCPETLKINHSVTASGYTRIEILRIQTKVTETAKGSRCIYSNSPGDSKNLVTCQLK